MISCAEAVRQLWEYMDGTAQPAEHEAIGHHLAFCRRCCGELEFARELRAALAAAAEEEVPDDVLARLTARLEDVSGR